MDAPALPRRRRVERPRAMVIAEVGCDYRLRAVGLRAADVIRDGEAEPDEREHTGRYQKPVAAREDLYDER
jgi:hypothetical protein